MFKRSLLLDYSHLGASKLVQNEQFLRWCREWISELYGVCGSSIRAARTEPHIVKYKSSASSSFKGIGTHQDGE